MGVLRQLSRQISGKFGKGTAAASVAVATEGSSEASFHSAQSAAQASEVGTPLKGYLAAQPHAAAPAAPASTSSSPGLSPRLATATPSGSALSTPVGSGLPMHNSSESAASVSPSRRGGGRALSRKFSSNKLILSAEPVTEALPGEIILPPELAEFDVGLSETGEPLEIQFSGKSARLPRSLSRSRVMSQADELSPADSGLAAHNGHASHARLTGDAGIQQAVEALQHLESQASAGVQAAASPSSDLEVHISGKSARAIKRLSSRQSLVSPPVEAH